MLGELFVKINENNKATKAQILDGFFIPEKEIKVLDISYQSGQEKCLIINEKGVFQWMDMDRVVPVRYLSLADILMKQVEQTQSVPKTTKGTKQVTLDDNIAEVSA